MPDTDESSENEESSDEELNSQGMAFLKRFSHIIFGEGVVHRSSHEERVEFAEQYARAPNLDFEEVTEILRYSAWFDHERVKVGEDPILERYASIFFATVVRERSVRAKKGIAIFSLFDGKIVGCIGQALNEGVTEMDSARMMKKMAEESDEMPSDFRQLILSADNLRLGDGAYYLAVKAAERVEAVVGQRILIRAYFGEWEDLEILASEFDGHFGEGTFLRILSLSDKGQWREVFKILKSRAGDKRSEGAGDGQ